MGHHAPQTMYIPYNPKDSRWFSTLLACTYEQLRGTTKPTQYENRIATPDRTAQINPKRGINIALCNLQGVAFLCAVWHITRASTEATR